MLLAETIEAVENIEEICAVARRDVIVPARFDLSPALGKPGQFDDPEFKAAIARIEAAALAANIPLGGTTLTAIQAAFPEATALSPGLMRSGYAALVRNLLTGARPERKSHDPATCYPDHPWC